MEVTNQTSFKEKNIALEGDSFSRLKFLLGGDNRTPIILLLIEFPRLSFVEITFGTIEKKQLH